MANSRSDKPDSVMAAIGLETTFGAGKGISCKLPFKIGATGAVPPPKSTWPGLAAGAAIAGIPLWIGENVCGFDLDTKFEMEKSFLRRNWNGGSSGIATGNFRATAILWCRRIRKSCCSKCRNMR